MGRLPMVRITTNVYVKTNETTRPSSRAFFLQETGFIAEEFEQSHNEYVYRKKRKGI